MTALPQLKYTLEEYLEIDRQAEARLEYWDGEIFDMSGVSDKHDQIEGNVFLYLKLRTKEQGCRTFTANMRIQVPSIAHTFRNSFARVTIHGFSMNTMILLMS